MTTNEPKTELTPTTKPAFLTVETPGAPSRIILMEADTYRLGRSSQNELSFPSDRLLSREHLVLEKGHDGGWTARDLGSQNGTRINGTRIGTSRVLEHGDRVQAGNLTIIFRTREERTPTLPKDISFVQQDAVSPSGTIVVNLQAALEASTGVADRPERAGSHMKAFVRAGRELAGIGIPDRLYEVALEIALESVEAARGLIMTSNQSGEFVVRAVRGGEFRISTAVRDLVIKGAKSLLIHDALWDRDLASQPSIVAQEVRSILAVPLQTEDRVMGLVYLDSPHVVREFSSGDLNLLTVIANIAAIRIEQARLVEKEQARKLLDQDFERAAEIQRRLLPSGPPDLSGVDLAGFNAPCRAVGGDYYDYLPYPDGRMGVLIGDVSGKGLGAALLMSGVQARSHVIFGSRSSLNEEVDHLNRSISAKFPKNCFVTFFIALVDPASERMHFCNAGHNAPVLLRADGQVELLEATGMPLGISRFATYDLGTQTLCPGDMLVLYSDGITEACGLNGDEEFGQDRLVETLQRLQGQPALTVIEEVRNAVQAFTGGNTADDVTLVVARRVAADS